MILIPASGEVEIFRGDDYYAAQGRELCWQDDSWLDFTGCPVVITIDRGWASSGEDSVFTDGVGGNKSVTQQLSRTVTRLLALRRRLYSLLVVKNGHVLTLRNAGWTSYDPE